MGAPLGFLLANGIFLILILSLGHDTTVIGSGSVLLDWAWRIPFLLSAVMVMIGLYVRLRLTETPVFRRALQRGERVSAPLTEVFRTSLPQLVIGTFVMLATYTLFYIVTTWMLSYIIGPRPPKGSGLGLEYAEALKLQLIAVLFFAATLPATGWLSDRFGRRLPLLVITAGIIGFGALFGPLLATDRASTTTVLLFLVIGMTLMGLTFGPMSAVLPELFPTNVRYTGSGISYNVASILGAAVAPFIAAWLVAHYGVAFVGLYLSLAAAVTFVALLVMKETSRASLDEVGG
jgi:MFS family permease